MGSRCLAVFKNIQILMHTHTQMWGIQKSCGNVPYYQHYVNLIL